MNFELLHSVTCYEMGPEARESYKSGIEKLKKAETYQEQVQILSGIFDSLSKSTPPAGRAIEWAEEIIKVYRNLGGIIKGLKPNDSSERLEARVSEFEKTFS